MIILIIKNYIINTILNYYTNSYNNTILFEMSIFQECVEGNGAEEKAAHPLNALPSGQWKQCCDEIMKIDVMSLTPLEALQKLFELQNKLKGM